MLQTLPKQKKTSRIIPALGPKQQTIDFILGYSKKMVAKSKDRKEHLEVTLN
jgi:hypothetical protein